MGLIQNKVTVSQPNSHVVVKNAGGLRGLTGETGPQGPQGVPGEAATVTAGTTTTLPAGSNATVQNVGSTSAAIFNFGIPKGDKGDTGESGAAATISVGTTTTLEPGEDATVTNSGTSSAAVFDFGIPKGDKGDTGATGADGYSPSATVTKTGDTATITITDKDGTTTASISDGTTPTVNDGTLTIQKNGTTVQTFSADQASNVTANITVPTQFSDLSGTVSSSQIEDEAITTGSVSGTGTNITLAGTMEGGAIESVEMYGDTQQQTYSGKNLFDKNSAATGYIVLRETGENSVNVNYVASDYIPVQAGEKYRFGSTINRWYSAYYDSNKQYTGYPTNTAIITIPSGVSYIRISTQVTNVDTAQFEKGEVETSYEPYVGGTASPNPDYPQEVQTVTGRQVVTISDGDSQSQEYEINLGKNLLNPDTLTADSRLNGDGSLLAGATGFSTSDYISVEPNTTYTITRDAASSGFFGNLCQYNSSKTMVGTREYWDNTASYWPFHITTSSTTRYIRVSDQTTLFGTSFQLEKGSTATTYAPYFTPIELCKIGTYQDYIYKSGEDWYVKKNIGKQNMSDLSGLSVISTGNFIATSFASNYGAVIGEMLSNIFTYSTTGWEKVGKFGVAASGNMWAMTGDSTITTANISTWLSDRSAVVYYELATPTDTQITNATLISELEGLLSATTYAGNTYITVSGDLASPLEVVAESDSKLAPDSVYGAAIKDGAVSTDKIEDGAVTPAKISTSAYQSGETAVGTWIDGKTIYRQVLTGTVQITANNVATVTTTIAAKSIVSTSGWYQSWKQNDTTSNKVAFGHLMGNNIYSYALIRSGNYIELGFISSVNVTSRYEVVVEYTKKD